MGGGPIDQRDATATHATAHVSSTAQLEHWGPTGWLSDQHIDTGIRAAAGTGQHDCFAYPHSVGTLQHNICRLRELVEGGQAVTRPTQKITAALLTRTSPIMIPFGDNMHWRAIMVTPSTNTIYMYDPMGEGSWNSSNECRALERALQRLNGALPRRSQWCLHKVTHVMQRDGHNCGIWIIWAAIAWAAYCEQHQPAQDFETHMVQRLRQHSDRRDYRSFINQQRNAYWEAVLRRQRTQPPASPEPSPGDTDSPQPDGQNELNARTTQSTAPDMQNGQIAPHNGKSVRSTRQPKPVPCKEGPGRRIQNKRVTSSRPRPPTSQTRARATRAADIQRKNNSHAPPAARNLRTATLQEILARHHARFPTHQDTEHTPARQAQPGSPGTPTTTRKRPRPHEPVEDAPPSATPTVGADEATCVNGNTEKLTILTWNPRSLNEDSVTELQNMIVSIEAPDFIFISETKCNASRRKKVSPCFPAYQIYSSAARPSTTVEPGQRQTWSAGTMVLVHNRYCKKGHSVKFETPPAQKAAQLQGHVAHVIVQTPHQPRLHLVGIYMPCVGEGMQDIRTTAYEYLQEVTTAARKAGERVLMGGDWNAALLASDRSSNALTSRDRAHAAFMQACGLHPLGGMRPRPHTYMAEADSNTTSRLDDVLLMTESAELHSAAPQPSGKRQQVTGHTGTAIGTEHCLHDTPVSDHAPLLHQLPPRALGIQRPKLHEDSPVQAERTVLARPVSKAALQDLKATLEARFLQSLERLHKQSAVLREQAEAGHMTESTVPDLPAAVDKLWNKIADTLQQCNAVALDILPTKTVGGVRRTGGYFTKQERKQYEAAWDTCAAAKYALRRAAEQPQRLKAPSFAAGVVPHQRQEERAIALEKLWHTFSTDPETTQSPNAQWVTHLEEAKATALQTMRDLQRARGRTAATKRAKKLQHKLDTAPGRAHKDIFRPGTEQGAPALRNPDKPEEITTDPTELTGIWHQHIHSMMGQAAATGVADTAPHSATAAQHPPWTEACPQAPDTYRLLTRANTVQPEERDNLKGRIADAGVYRECLAELAGGKTPGPDEVTNEVLKYLPDTMHTAMHNLFVAMYCTGHAPPDMLRSNTIMLHKKGDPLNPGNYRPIGLANTVLKLYTRLLTHVLQDFALQHDIITGSQEGFLPYRNTIRQVNTMVSIIEDAALTHQDLYVLYIDFTNAFNSVDHDRMQELMLMLGFPDMATQAVMSLYRGATTQVVTAAGTTAPIPIRRGTIQGDTLSPFLFLLYIEPLLRWLQAGGRGYKLGSLTHSDTKGAQRRKKAPTTSQQREAERLRCAAAAYADDLAATTGSLADMQVQAAKIERYAAWARLKVNVSKCAVTGVLHSERHHLPSGQCNKGMLQSLQSRLTGTVRIGGHPIPYLPPHEPYIYLGFELTMTLNWKHLYNRILRQTREAGEALVQCGARPQQKLRVLQTCICPAIHYHMPLAPYGPGDVARLDALVTQIAKRCCQLPRGTATALVREDLHNGGAGVTSLQTPYVQLAARDLIHCRNDEGRLGAMKRALLTLQLERSGGLAASEAGALARYSVQLRQLQLATVPGAVRIVEKGEPLHSATGGSLADTLRGIKVDPTDLGAWRRVDTSILTPLFELGIYNLADLVERPDPAGKGGRGDGAVRLIDTAMLTDLFGGRAAVRDTHRKALNRLTKLLHSDNAGVDHSRYSSPGPLPASERAIRHAHLFTELQDDSQRWPTIPGLWQHATERAATGDTQRPRDSTTQRPDTPGDANGVIGGWRTQRTERRTAPEKAAPHPALDGLPEAMATDDGDVHAPAQARQEGPAPMDVDSAASDAASAAGAIDAEPIQVSATPATRAMRRRKATGLRRSTNGRAPATAAKSDRRHAAAAEGGERCRTAAPGRSQSQLRRVVNTAPPRQHPAALQEVEGLQGADKPDLYYERRQGDSLAKTLAADPAAALAYYEDLEGIKAVTNDYMFNKIVTTGKGKGKKRHHQGSQKQARVQWRSTVVHKAHAAQYIAAYEARGYRANGEPRPYQGYGRWAAKQLVIIDWEDSSEPLDLVMAHADYTAELRGWAIQKRKCMKAAATRHRQRPDEVLSEEERQGIGLVPPPEAPLLTPEEAGRIFINTQEHHPELNVEPPGRYHMQLMPAPAKDAGDLRRNAAWLSDWWPVDAGAEVTHTDPPPAQTDGAVHLVCACYEPQGRCLGTLSTERARHLRARFEATRASNPHLFAELRAGPFEEEVAQLILRYKDGYREGNRRTTIKNHWASADELMHALRVGLGARTERYASPLNVSTGTTQYHSLYKRDQLFGAAWDAYRHRWLGSSEANPEYEHEEMERAVRWAIASARAGQQAGHAVLTVMVLPAWDATAYAQWLHHPDVHELMVLDRERFKFKRPTHWAGGQTYAGQPKWDVRVLVIANRAGVGRYYSRERLSAALAQATDILGEPRVNYDINVGQAAPGSSAALAGRKFRAPRRFTQAVARPASVAWGAGLPPTTVADATSSRWYRPCDNATAIYYTDGSCRREKGEGAVHCGSGIFGAGGEREALECRLTPGGRDGTNTILRAELIPILHVLQVLEAPPAPGVRDPVPLSIASDSKASLQLLRRMLASPQRLRFHKHRALLQEIVRAMRPYVQAGRCVVLNKVKGHSTVCGNNIADKLAVEAATGNGNHGNYSNHDHAQPTAAGICWAEVSSVAAPEGQPKWQPAGDLCTAIKNAARQKQDIRLGGAPMGVYATAWIESVVPHGCAAVNKAVTMAADTAVQRLVLKYRSGMLYTQKLAVRYGHSPDPRCPLCGMADSQTHMLLQCPGLKDHHLSRHNWAVTLIASAIQRGGKGRWHVAALDATAMPESDTHGRTVPRRPPDYLIPDCKHRPDIMLLEGVDRFDLTAYAGADLPPGIQNIHIVEVGYCNDTRWREKSEEKDKQHEQLAETMRQRLRQRFGDAVGPDGKHKRKVIRHSIPLGVSGFALKHNLEALQNLGLHREHARKCLAQLCHWSQQKLYDIVVQRRLRERDQSRGTHPGNQTRETRRRGTGG